MSKAKASANSVERPFRKTREGIVTSDKMDKTVVVAIQDRIKHGMYSKVLTRSRKLKAHDDPLSATKRWRVVEILEKAK